MIFLDEASILVRGGAGGSGCCSFRREAYVPRGGPDGGDGGDGGSVFLEADPQLGTLADIQNQAEYSAGNGRPGSGNNRTGRSGEDLVIRVPPGTVVRDAAAGAVLRDLANPGERVCAAKGGKGGKGNKAFATPTNRTPRQFEPGSPGEERRLELELKLIADVGLLGFPNAGKSTLLSRISNARPKVANYPFTTLEPQLGIARLNEDRSLVVADLPGLIEGAHEGTGLGDRFLRHVERTRVLCHMVDAADASSPMHGRYCAIREELSAYSTALAAKPEIVAATKMDVTGADENADELERALGRPVHRISPATGQGVRELLIALAKELR